MSETPSDPTSTLAKSFEPHTIEAHWGPEWEKRAYAAPTFDENKKDFSIQLPPPIAHAPKPTRVMAMSVRPRVCLARFSVMVPLVR